MTSSADHTILRGDAAASAAPAEAFPAIITSVEPTGLWAERAEAAEADSRRVGFEEGLAEGRAEGYARAYEEGRAACATAIGAVDKLVANLRDADRLVGEEIGEETTEFAMAAVEAILSRELAVASDPGLEAIARCLAVAPALGDIEARLHPEDIKTLGHTESVTGERRLSIVPDPSLQRGDAIVTVEDTTIDGRLAGALDRLRDALR